MRIEWWPEYTLQIYEQKKNLGMEIVQEFFQFYEIVAVAFVNDGIYYNNNHKPFI